MDRKEERERKTSNAVSLFFRHSACSPSFCQPSKSTDAIEDKDVWNLKQKQEHLLLDINWLKMRYDRANELSRLYFQNHLYYENAPGSCNRKIIVRCNDDDAEVSEWMSSIRKERDCALSSDKVMQAVHMVEKLFETAVSRIQEEAETQVQLQGELATIRDAYTSLMFNNEKCAQRLSELKNEEALLAEKRKQRHEKIRELWEKLSSAFRKNVIDTETPAEGSGLLKHVLEHMSKLKDSVLEKEEDVENLNREVVLLDARCKEHNAALIEEKKLAQNLEESLSTKVAECRMYDSIKNKLENENENLLSKNIEMNRLLKEKRKAVLQKQHELMVKKELLRNLKEEEVLRRHEAFLYEEAMNRKKKKLLKKNKGKNPFKRSRKEIFEL